MENHIANLCRKLDVNTRADLLARAMEAAPSPILNQRASIEKTT